MKTPDKIFVNADPFGFMCAYDIENHPSCGEEYIRKDALIEYLQKEMERLWEIIPDASNDAPTQMELRYLGEYMATERLIDEIKEL